MSSLFHYRARSADGEAVAGALMADSLDHALAHLRSRSLAVTSLENSPAQNVGLRLSLLSLASTHSARVVFFRSFATLVSAGVPLRHALQVTVEECVNARLAEALRSLINDIESGASLAIAMARRPREFPPLCVAMVKAGEVGGTMPDVLERLADLMERDRVLRKRVTVALTYPAIVTATSIALVCFLVANTVPAFAAMFDELHVQLPLTTRVFIVIGRALQSTAFYALLLAGLLCLAAAWHAAARSPQVRDWFDAAVLRLPLIGAIVRKSTIARFSRCLGSLLESGVALASALEASREVLQNARYARFVTDLGESLRQGNPIAAQLAHTTLFDALFVQLVRVGEETGRLDSMLLRLAQYYEFDVESAIATLGSALEPALIVGLGAIVGTIVASVLIPLYSIIGSIK